MATGEMEIEFPGYIGSYTMTAVASEPGEPPTRIFDIHDDVVVAVDWTIPEYLNRIICGTYDCDLYLESMGKGKEFEIEGPVVPCDQATNTYHASILIPHDSIVPAQDETDIVYKMTVSITYKNNLGKPGPIAGFVELPMVQFYLDA